MTLSYGVSFQSMSTSKTSISIPCPVDCDDIDPLREGTTLDSGNICSSQPSRNRYLFHC